LETNYNKWVLVDIVVKPHVVKVGVFGEASRSLSVGGFLIMSLG